jgi:hypothetical protein
MSNILNSYISKFLVNLKKENDDVVKVTTKYFSPQGDVYELDKRTISPNLIQTTQSLQELNPEISDVYPFKTVTPLDYDGSTLVFVPATDTIPTASQGYYAPIYFERYNSEIIANIDTQFLELEPATLSATEITTVNFS